MSTGRASIAFALFVAACGGQAKQVVVVPPTDDEISIERRPVQAPPSLRAEPLPAVATIANVERDLPEIVDRVAPRHPLGLMVRMGLRAGLGGIVGNDLAQAVDLSQPIGFALASVGSESALLVATRLLPGSAARLQGAIGTQPLAGGHLLLLGSGAPSDARYTLGDDLHCVLVKPDPGSLVCADDDRALFDHALALLEARAAADDKVAISVRFDHERVADAAQIQDQWSELRVLSPLTNRFQFDGRLDHGVVELQLVDGGFDLAFASLGVLGTDLMSRLALAPPLLDAQGRPLPPDFRGPQDLLSVIAVRGVDLAPFRDDLDQLSAVLQSLSTDNPIPQAARDQLAKVGWPGGPFILAYGHDLGAAEATLTKELARRKPRVTRLSEAGSGYVLVGTRMPFEDAVVLADVLSALEQAEGHGTARVRAARGAARLPKGARWVELSARSDELGDDPGDHAAARPHHLVFAQQGEWVWGALSASRKLAEQRLGETLALRKQAPASVSAPPGATEQSARAAALRPEGVEQASVLGYVSLASASSLVLWPELIDDRAQALTALQRALAHPDMIDTPIPLRVTIDADPQKRFRAELRVHLPTSLVAEIFEIATEEDDGEGPLIPSATRGTP